MTHDWNFKGLNLTLEQFFQFVLWIILQILKPWQQLYSNDNFTTGVVGADKNVAYGSIILQYEQRAEDVGVPAKSFFLEKKRLYWQIFLKALLQKAPNYQRQSWFYKLKTAFLCWTRIDGISKKSRRLQLPDWKTKLRLSSLVKGVITLWLQMTVEWLPCARLK